MVRACEHWLWSLKAGAEVGGESIVNFRVDKHLLGARFWDCVDRQGAGETKCRRLGIGGGCGFVVVAFSHNETAMSRRGEARWTGGPRLKCDDAKKILGKQLCRSCWEVVGQC